MLPPVRRALVVEDDPDIVELVTLYLSRDGWAVEAAGDGRSALQRLQGGGYELVVLQFDGSNFRIVSTTPLTGNANGMSVLVGTPSSSSAPCQTGALQSDSDYLYFCTAPNTWKRTALSSF